MTRIDVARYISEQTMKPKLPARFAEKVAGYLIAEHRSGELEHIMRDVRELRAKNGHIEADVRTARPMPAATEAAVRRLIKQRYPKAVSITIIKHIDPSLIGGIAVELPDERVDLTVAGRLRVFRRAVSEGHL